MFIGGTNNQGRADRCFVEEIDVLNLENLNWISIQLVSEGHLRRTEHSTAVSEDHSKIYIFGGVGGDFLLTN